MYDIDFNNPNPNGCRVIKTARSVASINNAALEGYRPLVKPVIPLKEIKSKYAVIQNTKTGEIAVLGDYRSYPKEGWETVIDFTFYYPHSFKSPFAAYLIPPNLQVGETVFLEDLIEDYIESEWNQGDVYRLKFFLAVWNGKDFEIQGDPNKPRMQIVG